MAWAISPAKLLLRDTYRLLSQRDSWNCILYLNNEVISELQWWLNAAMLWNSYEVRSHNIDFQLITDASHIGYGGVLLGPNDTKHIASQEWNRRVSTQSSNYRELLAILMCLIAFRDIIRDKCIEILSDNITAIAYVNFKGGPSKELTQIATAIWAEALNNGTYINCSHIAGKLNEADIWSRTPDKHDWMLHPQLFQFIDQTFGPHTIDRFASLKSAQLPKFNSRYAEPLSCGIDALAQQDWATENNFVNAPFCLLDRVLNTIIHQRAVATVIAPYWPGQVWFRKLLRLLVAAPINIPNLPRSFRHMGISNPEPLRNRAWKLYAWRIYGGNV